MKKIIRLFLICALLIVFVYIALKTSVIYNIMSIIVSQTPDSNRTFEDKQYYSQLTEVEKNIYSKIDTSITNLDETVIILSPGDLTYENVTKAYDSYILDFPELFYLKANYDILEVNIFNNKKVTIKLEYIENNRIKLQQKIDNFNDEMQKIISSVVTNQMTDFEKELAIHDYLVSSIKYYEYENEEDIPQRKHTAYGALIEKEAVCDGISKAFSILLDKVGVKAIVVSGKLGNTAHAWNKVRINGKWYNVDVTSDTCSEERIPIHAYFNLTDKNISKTHTISQIMKTPSCISSNHEYYSYNKYQIDKYGDVKSNISRIIQDTKGKALEFRVENLDVTIQEIADTLYKLDFNGYKEIEANKIEYYHIDNIYIFIKK